MKRKIGILTFHRANNYGAVLQCYALQETVKALGHNVEIINYKQPYIEKIYKPIKKSELLNVLKRPRWYYSFFFKILPERILTYTKYWSFRERHLKTGKAFDKNKETLSEYDTIIIGSDQVWGLHCTNGVDEIFFGELPKKKNNVIGYGISGNIDSLRKIGTSNLTKYYHNFNAISFREESFQTYIKEHIGSEGFLVLDPTLLLDKRNWEVLTNQTKEKEDYILTYLLQEVTDVSKLNKNLVLFAKRENCKLINIFDVAHSPTEFLSWIKNAKYIFTTSFHAAVFSIIFNKEVYALKTHNGHDTRYINLFNRLGLCDRAIEVDSIVNMGISPIDYYKVNAKHSLLKEESIKFLTESLNKK